MDTRFSVPILSDTSAKQYSDWKKDIQIWMSGSSVNARKYGPLIYSALSGAARDNIRYVPLEALNDGTIGANGLPANVSNIFSRLDGLFLGNTDDVSFSRWYELSEMKRESEVPILSFLTQFHEMKLRMNEFLEFDTHMLALMLLTRLRLSEMQRSLLFANLLTNGKSLKDLQYDELVSGVRRIFSGDTLTSTPTSHTENRIVALQCADGNFDSEWDLDENMVARVRYQKGKGKGKGKPMGSGKGKGKHHSQASSSSFNSGKGRFGSYKSGSVKYGGKNSGKSSFRGNCYTCGKYGHTSKYCHSNTVSTVVTKDAIPAESIPKDNTGFCVSVFTMDAVNEMDVSVATIDTGCAENVVGYGFLKTFSKVKKMKFQRLEGRNKFIYANGHTDYSLMRVRLPVTIGKVETTFDVDVLPHVTTPLLISLNYMRKVGFVVDCSDDTLSCHQLGLEKFPLEVNKSGNYVFPILPYGYSDFYAKNRRPLAQPILKPVSHVSCVVDEISDLEDSLDLSAYYGFHSSSLEDCVEDVSADVFSRNVDDRVALVDSDGQEFAVYSVATRFGLEAIALREWNEKSFEQLHLKMTHMSRDKLWNILKQGGIDPKHKKLFDATMDKCVVCAKFGRRHQKPNTGGFVSKSFNQLVGADLTELKFAGRKYIVMVMVDLYSRWMLATRLSDKTGESILRVIMDWASRTGRYPHTLLTDNGREFSNHKVYELCSRFDMAYVTTSPESPWANGVVENKNAILKAVFARAATDLKGLAVNTDSILSETSRIVNSIPRKDINLSPFQIAFGLPSTPWNDGIDTAPTQQFPKEDINKSLRDRLVMSDKIRDFVMSSECNRIVNEALRKKRRSTEEPFFPGELVGLWHPPDKNNSVGYYSGPYHVKNSIGSSYDIKQGADTRTVSGHLLTRKEALISGFRSSSRESETTTRDVGIGMDSVGNGLRSDWNPGLGIPSTTSHGVVDSVPIVSPDRHVPPRMDDTAMPTADEIMPSGVSISYGGPDEHAIVPVPAVERPSVTHSRSVSREIPVDLSRGSSLSVVPTPEHQLALRDPHLSLSESSITPVSPADGSFVEREVFSPIRNQATSTYDLESPVLPARRGNQDSQDTRIICSDCGVFVDMDCYDSHKELFCRPRKVRRIGSVAVVFQALSGVQVSSNVPASASDVKHFQDEFRTAKLKELRNWKSHGVYEIIPYSVDLAGKNLMSSIWVNTWKRSGATSIAKSRLVVRGYEDHESDTLVTDSPTASKMCIRILLSWAACHSFVPNSMDLKTAFLQSTPYSDMDGREVYISLPQDVHSLLNIPKDSVFRLLKCVYGMKDAPMIWYRTISSFLIKCGMVRCSVDYGFFSYRKNGILHGLIALHVDDLIMAGSTVFYTDVIASLRTHYIIGSEVSSNFAFCGIDISSTVSDSGVVAIKFSQSQYSASISEMHVPRRSDDSFLTSTEYTQFRSRLGALSWVSLQSRPDISYSTNQLSMIQSKPTVENAKSLNKLIRELKSVSRADLAICFRKLQNPYICIISDGSFGRNHDGSSSGGYFVLLTDARASTQSNFSFSLQDVSVHSFHLIEWKSYKLKRVTRSALASEIIAFSDALDTAQFVNRVYQEISGSNLRIVAYTDSQSLRNSAYSNKNMTERMLLINIAAIRDALQAGILEKILYVPTKQNIADYLTKYIANKSFLVEILKQSRIPLPI